tara:strand:+ start:755 stop:1339 length:585 start_codon:yes stop_codon:yes gene_type:complete
MISKEFRINNRNFIKYKFLNSLFLGISIGTYVIQYKPLKIDDFPVMGIFFAILAIPIAMFYSKIMTINYFYKFSLFVEVLMVVWIIGFLTEPYSYQIALLIYIFRQITFLFGDFLYRAETIFIQKTEILSKIDVIKQIGNISGMIISVIFYKILENKYLIIENNTKVYYVHFLLLIIQSTILFFLVKSFEKNKN